MAIDESERLVIATSFNSWIRVKNKKRLQPNLIRVVVYLSTKISILKTEDREIVGFRAFEFDILNLLGICHLALGAFR
jgi:hypothetical protein